MADGGTGQRVVVLDMARTLALVCMVIFHFTFDLMLFGYLPAGYVFSGFWPLFARAIAGSFLFLAGVSLWLAHGRGLRWPSFWRRFAIVAGAAALVSVATRFGLGEAWVRFGILHAIAASSLIGVAFLRLPVWVTLATAIAIFAAPWGLQSPAFAAPWLLWLGLSPEVPPMMDFEPLLPWTAPFLVGVALGKLGSQTGAWARLMLPTPDRASLAAFLVWPGRHSLSLYLIHQPVLFGGLWIFTYLSNGV